MLSVSAKFSHKRYDWLDDARGIVSLLFIVSIVTWTLSGNVITGDTPVGPPHLNHGYLYYKGHPPIITIIDVGQALFLFMVGVSAYLAFSSRLRKHGAAKAWTYGARRVFVLLLLSFLTELGLRRGWDVTRVDWGLVFMWDVIAHLAWGCLAAYLAIFFVRSPERRAMVGFAIFIVHAFIFAAHITDQHPWMDYVLELPRVPLGVINLCAIAILGSAVGQWITRNPEDPAVGMRERIVPLGGYCMAASFCLEWVQPSEHHDVTTALALMGVGLGSLLIAASYSMHSIGAKLPLLGSLGRNLLFVFIVAGLGMDLVYAVVPRGLIRSDPFVAMVLAGILPIAVMVGLTRLLEKWNIAIRA